MSKKVGHPAVLALGRALLIAFLVGIPLFLLGLPLLYYFGGLHVAYHLTAGWFHFLRENLGRSTTNAATWVPGVVAFFVAVAVGHIFLKGWADRRAREWSAGKTLALSMVLPVCFVISFLIPGVILQGRQLAAVDWVHRSPSKPGAEQQHMIRQLQADLFEWSVPLDGSRISFPGSLSDLEVVKSGEWLRWAGRSGDASPPELPIYFGAGLDIDSDPGLPLLISARFPSRGGFSRYLATIGGELIMIRDEETDAWIQRALDARAENAR